MPAIDRLCANDLSELYTSGLTDKTIAANEIRTKNNALVFPYRNLKGEVNGFYRRKPHKPRLNKDGEPIKYEQPRAVPPRPYYPKGSLAKLIDGRSPIFVTEGEKKALALSQLDLAAIGLGGVYGWKSKDIEGLIADLAQIEWDGRDVYVVFDYDEKPKTRSDVRLAMRRLTTALKTAGAHEVYNVVLPPGPDGEKQGVDDFLVANDDDAFRALVDEAERLSPTSRRIP